MNLDLFSAATCVRGLDVAIRAGPPQLGLDGVAPIHRGGVTSKAFAGEILIGYMHGTSLLVFFFIPVDPNNRIFPFSLMI